MDAMRGRQSDQLKMPRPDTYTIGETVVIDLPHQICAGRLNITVSSAFGRLNPQDS